MTSEQRLELARRQKELYIETLPSWSNVKENLGNVLLQKTYTN